MLPYTSVDLLRAMRRDHGLDTNAAHVTSAAPERRRRRAIIAGMLLALRMAALPR